MELTVSSLSISKSTLYTGDTFTATIKVKNNLSVKADIAEFYGSIEIPYEYYGDIQTETVIIAYADGISVPWKAGETKTVTVSFTVTDDVWERLQSIKEWHPDADTRRNVINWSFYLGSSTDLNEFAYGHVDNKGVFFDYKYAPAVDVFFLERIMDGVPNDEGVNLMADMKLSVSDRAQMDLLSLKLHYAEGASASTSSPYIDLTTHIPDLLAGVTDSTTLISETFANNLNWNFLLVFGDTYESAQARFTVARAFANLHLSGASTGGAAFGGFSTSTEDNPLLECHYPAKFYAGIDGVTTYTTGEGKLNATYWTEGTVSWYKYGRIVMVVCRDLKPNAAKMPDTWTAYEIATGLPAPVAEFRGVHVLPDRFDYGAFLTVDVNGLLKYHQRNIVMSDVTGNRYLHASFCYISAS